MPSLTPQLSTQLTPFQGERPPSAEPIVVEADEPCETALGAIGAILDEDMANISRLQRGLEASPTGQINLARYHESRIRHFHRTLSEYLSG